MTYVQSRPDRVTQAIKAGAIIPLLGAGALSFVDQYHLGQAVGWKGALAVLLPLGVEVQAAIATTVWFRSRSPELARKARRDAMLAIGLSVLLNGLWMLLNAGVIEMAWPIILGVSMVPPYVVASVLHLAMSLPAGTPGESGVTLESRPEPEVGPQPVPEPLRVVVEVPEVPVAGAAKVPELPGGGSTFVRGEEEAASVEVTVLPEPVVAQRNGSVSARNRKVPAKALDAALEYVVAQVEAGREGASIKATELVPVLETSDSWARVVMRELRNQYPELKVPQGRELVPA